MMANIIQWHGPDIRERLAEAQHKVDEEVLGRCKPLIPFDRGILIGSGTLNTTPGTGEIRYRTPYARRWYYEPAKFAGAPHRGNLWFERMKRDGGERAIRAEAARILLGHK